MGRDPIKNHADIVPMEVIDKVRKVFGRAVPAGDGKIADRLITPRARIGMLADRQEFNVGEAEVARVGGKLLGELAIAQPAVTFFGAAAP